MADTRPNTKIGTLTLRTWFRESQSTQNSERWVLSALIDRADVKKGYVCWPSIDTVMKDTQLGRTVVKAALRKLEAKGLIRRNPRFNKSTVYNICIDQLRRDAQQAYTDQLEHLYTAFVDTFAEHPFINDGTFDESQLHEDLESCADVAGGAARCADLLVAVKEQNPDAWEELWAAEDLGSHLRDHILEWNERYGYEPAN